MCGGVICSLSLCLASVLQVEVYSRHPYLAGVVCPEGGGSQCAGAEAAESAGPGQDQGDSGGRGLASLGALSSCTP